MFKISYDIAWSSKIEMLRCHTELRGFVINLVDEEIDTVLLTAAAEWAAHKVVKKIAELNAVP